MRILIRYVFFCLYQSLTRCGQHFLYKTRIQVKKSEFQMFGVVTVQGFLLGRRGKIINLEYRFMYIGLQVGSYSYRLHGIIGLKSLTYMGFCQNVIGKEIFYIAEYFFIVYFNSDSDVSAEGNIRRPPKKRVNFQAEKLTLLNSYQLRPLIFLQILPVVTSASDQFSRLQVVPPPRLKLVGDTVTNDE